MDRTTLTAIASSFKAALQRGDRVALLAAARRLMEHQAPLGDQWRGLAQAVFEQGELQLALAALRFWGRQGAPPFAVAYDSAILSAKAGRSEQAAKLMAGIDSAFPTVLANAYLQGALSLSLGKPGEAETHFRRALLHAPQSGKAWLALVQTGRATDADVEKMLLVRKSLARTGGEELAALENALGGMAHRQHRFEAAFGHFSGAARIWRGLVEYRPQDNEQSASIAASWTADVVAELALAPECRTPIFVTGLPRSGTTLVEQIIATHSAVDGGGELNLARHLESASGGLSPEDIRGFLSNGGRLEGLRDTYLSLVSERFPGDGRFIDKTINQSRSMGLMAALFPNAPIIWLRRDPLENAFSIFRTWFSANLEWSWSLEDIADYMRVEDRLHAHYTREMPDRILTVPYEGLVDDPRGWTARIMRHCGLEIEETQHEFHRTNRAVTTASAMQVREPINRKGLHSAEPYRPFLEPFMEAYFGR